MSSRGGRGRKKAARGGAASGSRSAGAARPESGAGGKPASAERIVVTARMRPQLEREEGFPQATEIGPDGRTVLVSVGTRVVRYAFDRAYPSECTQLDVFKQVKPIVASVLDGYNATVFAYGQTGTGKTHTMLGVDLYEAVDAEAAPLLSELDDTEWGVIPRSARLLFTHLARKRRKVEYKVWATYLEIYNERVYDLLAYEDSRMIKTGLEVRESKRRGVFVPDAVALPVRDEQECLDVLWRGACNRAVSSTDMNEHSSRSHTILQLIVEQTSKAEGGSVKRSKLNLVDLAGSEKWKSHQLTAFSAERIAELTSINKSLSTLGNCIQALLKRGRRHVPYRNSKLTRLLQDSLGGNTRTTFIVTLSPSSLAVDETLSTLQFADRAKQVVVHAKKNETVDDATLIKKQEAEIARLKALLAAAAKGGALPEGLLEGKASEDDGEYSGDGDSDSRFEALREEVEMLREENVALLEEAKAAKARYLAERRLASDLLAPLRKGAATAATVQLRVAEQMMAELEQRLVDMDELEEERRQQQMALTKYNGWLKSLPIARDGGEDSDGDGGGDAEEDSGPQLTLRSKLSLMEWSVVMQSEQLQRVRRMFLKDVHGLQQQLEERMEALAAARSAVEDLQATLEDKEVELEEAVSRGGGSGGGGSGEGESEGEGDAAPRKSKSVRGNWRRIMDKTGRPYFHNLKTGKVQWAVPSVWRKADSGTRKRERLQAKLAEEWEVMASYCRQHTFRTAEALGEELGDIIDDATGFDGLHDVEMSAESLEELKISLRNWLEEGMMDLEGKVREGLDTSQKVVGRLLA